LFKLKELTLSCNSPIVTPWLVIVPSAAVTLLVKAVTVDLAALVSTTLAKFYKSV
jgi:hypothetical protein